MCALLIVCGALWNYPSGLASPSCVIAYGSTPGRRFFGCTRSCGALPIDVLRVAPVPSSANVASIVSSPSARGERMKQAKADAQELIGAYRSERQDEFNNMVLSAGESQRD